MLMLVQLLVENLIVDLIFLKLCCSSNLMRQSVDYLISQLKVEFDQYAVLGPVKNSCNDVSAVQLFFFFYLFFFFFYSDPSNVVIKDLMEAGQLTTKSVN